MSEKPNNGLPAVFMHSFTFAGGARNLRIVKKACEMRLEELQNLAFNAEPKQACNFKYEALEGMDNVRVNLYGGTTKDAVMIGYNIATLQLNPQWL